MPKMQVYLPDELYERLKTHGQHINVSGVLQEALARQLGNEERRQAAIEAIADYEAEFGKITEEEMRAQEEADRRNAVRPPPRPQRATPQ